MSRRRLPPLLALRSFEAAGRLSSFTLAASELYVTQGAISRQVRILEDFLQQKLFVRLTRQIELTEEGREYLEQVQVALGIIEKATRRRLQDDTQRALTIDVLPTLATHWLMPRLSAFKERHPEIEVRLTSSIEPANLSNKSIDVAIRVGRLPGRHYTPSNPRIELEMTRSWQDIEAYELFDDVLVPVMSAALARQGETVRQASDLLQFPIIHNVTRKNAWADWLACHGVRNHDGTRSLDYSHFFMTLQAAIEGKGVALIPHVIFKNLDTKKGLFSPIKSKQSSAGKYYILVRETSLSDPAVIAIRDWLLEEARKEFPEIGDDYVTYPEPAPRKLPV